MKVISEMTTAEMVAEYNQITGKSIKKFSSRSTGEIQLARVRGGSAPVPLPAKTSDVPSGPASKKRAESQREAWGNRKVAAARSQRDNVNVAGETYRSVGDAFRKIGLPMNKHIAFRKELKASKAATFTFNDKRYNFKIVEAQE